MSNCKNESMEVWEQRYPVRFNRYELIHDSAGPGMWRGGLGVTRELQLLLPTVLTANADRHRLPPPGLLGGGDGSVNRFSIIRDGRDRTFSELFDTPSPSKFTNIQVQAGDVLAVTQGGGGGYGDPLQRDPDMVSRDVKDGYVSADRVAAAYGVVLGAGDGRADQSATTQLRMQQRKAVQP
jgi:N-methylhydantoinase B/oxoprolinase/acetone carboxylase alpha subunit